MTTMRFDLAQTAHVKLEGYDVGGWRVRTLVDDVRSQERHAIAWNGSDDDGRPVASGLYSYRLATGDYAKSRRIVLLR